MHTYRAVISDDPNVCAYEVGYFGPDDDGDEIWHPLHTFRFARNANRYVNYLNGGNGDLFHEAEEEEDI